MWTCGVAAPHSHLRCKNFQHHGVFIHKCTNTSTNAYAACASTFSNRALRAGAARVQHGVPAVFTSLPCLAAPTRAKNRCDTERLENMSAPRERRGCTMSPTRCRAFAGVVTAEDSHISTRVDAS